MTPALYPPLYIEAYVRWPWRVNLRLDFGNSIVIVTIGNHHFDNSNQRFNDWMVIGQTSISLIQFCRLVNQNFVYSILILPIRERTFCRLNCDFADSWALFWRLCKHHFDDSNQQFIYSILILLIGKPAFCWFNLDFADWRTSILPIQTKQHCAINLHTTCRLYSLIPNL